MVFDSPWTLGLVGALRTAKVLPVFDIQQGLQGKLAIMEKYVEVVAKPAMVTVFGQHIQKMIVTLKESLKEIDGGDEWKPEAVNDLLAHRDVDLGKWKTIRTRINAMKEKDNLDIPYYSALGFEQRLH